MDICVGLYCESACYTVYCVCRAAALKTKGAVLAGVCRCVRSWRKCADFKNRNEVISVKKVQIDKIQKQHGLT